MIEWPLVFLGGLLGSSHCLGMCGGFAVSVGLGAATFRENLQRQIAYTLGRMFTYSVAGGVAGFAGFRLSASIGSLSLFQAALSLIAGGLLVYQGLRSAGVFRRRILRRSIEPFCPAQSLFATVLTVPGLANTFLAGVLTGFLPCGLVYAYLALAASTGNMPTGGVTMALFGAGTAPLMIIAGSGMSVVSLATRRRVLNIAAWCVVVTGVLTLARGANAWSAGYDTAARCPLCETCTERDSTSPTHSERAYPAEN